MNIGNAFSYNPIKILKWIVVRNRYRAKRGVIPELESKTISNKSFQTVNLHNHYLPSLAAIQSITGNRLLESSRFIIDDIGKWQLIANYYNKLISSGEQLKQCFEFDLKNIDYRNIYTEYRFNFETLYLKSKGKPELLLIDLKRILDESNEKNDRIDNITIGFQPDNKKYILMKWLFIKEQFKARNIVGFDINGTVHLVNLLKYKWLFTDAQENNIPYTIHCGEWDNKTSISDALKLGAKRLGHATKADKSQIAKIKATGVHIESCLSSNVYLGVVEKPEIHPIPIFKDQGLSFSINTDDDLYFDTNIQKEYRLIQNIFNFNKSDFKEINSNAIKAAFLSDENKKNLLNRLK